MSARRVIVDLRRHRTSVPYIVSLLRQWIADLGGATVEWLLQPSQAQFLPHENHLGLAEASDDEWTEKICQRILDTRASEENVSFWIMSFDNALLGSARAVAGRGLPVTAVYLGTIMSDPSLKSRVRSDSLRRAPTSPQENMPLEESCRLTRELLQQGGHTSSEHPLMLSQLRPRLAQLDPRANGPHALGSSLPLIKETVARGRREGWLSSRLLQPGNTGTTAIYLATAASDSGASQPPPAALVAPVNVDNKRESGKSRADEFEASLTNARIGAFPRTREFVFSAVEAVIERDAYEPLLISELLEVSLSGARAQEEATGATNEKNWEVAGRCVMRLMCKAGVLLTKDDAQIADGIGRESKRVHRLADDFRLHCESLLAEFIIRDAGTFHYDNDTYYLGLTLYREGSSNKLSVSEIKEKGDLLLAFMEQEGRIEMGQDLIVKCKGEPRRSATVTHRS